MDHSFLGIRAEVAQSTALFSLSLLASVSLRVRLGIPVWIRARGRLSDSRQMKKPPEGG